MPDYRHFVLKNTASPESYATTRRGRDDFRTPPRDHRRTHGERLIKQLRDIEKQADIELKKAPATDGLRFIPICFQGELLTSDRKPFGGLRLKSLEGKDTRVLNVREKDGKQYATIAVPRNKIESLIRKVQKYIQKDSPKSGEPRNRKLIESISEIRLAALRDCYTDLDDNPPPVTETIWWETWLDFRGNAAAESDFKQQAQQSKIELSQQIVRFPEVTVILARTSLRQWSQFPGLLNYLAEFRRAKIVSTEFLDLNPRDQAEFVQALLGRTTYAPVNAPAVCILDTGVNRGHPLLSQALREEDTQAWNPEWTSADRHGHGTELAGLALFGPRLKELLLDDTNVPLSHRLESVKIWPDHGANEPPDYGPITVGSMALAELKRPQRNRVYCLAITADDRDKYLPTLWSADLDQACSGASDGHRRLLLVSAGNLKENPGKNYPDDNHLASIQDPAQSWNVLAVGAHTGKVWVEDKKLKDWTPVAPKGRLSPASTTSLAWDQQEWPIKPEIVLEGGNYAKDTTGDVSDVDDLAILTTQLSLTGHSLGTTRDTSASVAQAARMAAIIQAEYPDYWPETIRGLLVHTAKWTKEMKQEFARKTKTHKVPKERLRCYGWGVPNLDKALRCGKHIATMVIQDALQPLCKRNGKIKTNQMNIHTLPFPKDVLSGLGGEEVLMRVTLSYFIEPSPGRKGWKANHRYASHGLRFDVKRPTDSLGQFKQYLSRVFWDQSTEDAKKKVRPAKRDKNERNWIIGEFGKIKGSIHSDWWVGTASQLAESEYIGVYPITGWWRERPSQQCYNKQARYSLIVTIQTKSNEVELYNYVEQEIIIKTPSLVSTNVKGV